MVDFSVVNNDKIVLSDNEKLILAKGPKFAVRQEIMEENFKVELEKMICKEKFSEPQDELLSQSLFL